MDDENTLASGNHEKQACQQYREISMGITSTKSDRSDESSRGFRGKV